MSWGLGARGAAGLGIPLKDGADEYGGLADGGGYGHGGVINRVTIGADDGGDKAT